MYDVPVYRYGDDGYTGTGLCGSDFDVFGCFLNLFAFTGVFVLFMAFLGCFV